MRQLSRLALRGQWFLNTLYTIRWWRQLVRDRESLWSEAGSSPAVVRPRIFLPDSLADRARGPRWEYLCCTAAISGNQMYTPLDAMAHATRLTREGKLTEAVAAIQQALRGTATEEQGDVVVDAAQDAAGARARQE